MKKVVLTFLTVFMAVGISACGNTDAKQQVDNHYENFEQPSVDEIENAIKQAELDEKTEKYSNSEYEKVSVKAVSSDRLEHLTKFVKYDLTGSREVNWNDERNTVVDFYIPKELFKEVSYSEDGSEAYVTILGSTEGLGNSSNIADVFPMTLKLSVVCEGFFDNGSFSDREDAIQDFEEKYAKLVDDKYVVQSEFISDKWKKYTVDILSELVSTGTRGTIKTIYSKTEEGTYYPYEVSGWYREALSDKYTAEMLLSVIDDESAEPSSIERNIASTVAEYNPEVMYEIFNVIKIDYTENE